MAFGVSDRKGCSQTVWRVLCQDSRAVSTVCWPRVCWVSLDCHSTCLGLTCLGYKLGSIILPLPLLSGPEEWLGGVTA